MNSVLKFEGGCEVDPRRFSQAFTCDTMSDSKTVRDVKSKKHSDKGRRDRRQIIGRACIELNGQVSKRHRRNCR